jgi:hypothetical protein
MMLTKVHGINDGKKAPFLRMCFLSKMNQQPQQSDLSQKSAESLRRSGNTYFTSLRISSSTVVANGSPS